MFVLLQSGLGGITLLSASYTNYLIDLSDSMSFGLSVFALIKLIQSMDDRWSRARPGFRRLRRPGEGGQVLVLAYTGERLPGESARELQGALEGIVGHANVVRIDDLFGGESFVRSACARFRCVLVHAPESQRPALDALLAQAAWQVVERTAFELDIDWDPEQPAFAREVAPRVLDCAARLLQPEPAAPVAA